ncbi:MAG: CUGBP Elav-like member 2, partial [Paramarteilia canceri]
MVFYSSKKPDNDSIRLFVGRIPRQLKEDEVYKLFRHFGDIYSVIVIRDQKTDLSQ